MTDRKMVVVGADDGIILDLNRCVILDESALGEADRNLLNYGTETDALSVANRLGTSLAGILEGCGYGDLHYFNCIAMSPIALREEFIELPSMIDETMENFEKFKQLLEWGASLSNEKLSELAYDALQDDNLWKQWRFSVIASLEHLYHHAMEEETKS